MQLRGEPVQSLTVAPDPAQSATHKDVHMQTHAHANMCACKYVCEQVRTNTHTHICTTHTHTHTHTHTYTHTVKREDHPAGPDTALPLGSA